MYLWYNNAELYNFGGAASRGDGIMVYLVLAVISSVLVSVLMRLSTDRVKQNVAMLAVNYMMCLLLAAIYAGAGALVPDVPALGQTLGMGALNGALYLAGFVLLQMNVEKNGVVLSATFMKLGLLVPIAVSVLVFGEKPELLQVIGFFLAVAAIILINRNKNGGSVRSGGGLVLLLLCGGCGDVMAKIFEELGEKTLEEQFLVYTFVAALLLCLALMFARKQRPGAVEVLFGVLIGIPNFFSAKFLLGALESVPAVIAYPTYSVATLLIITLTGVVLFHEKLRKHQWGALVIILLALVLLNI